MSPASGSLGKTSRPAAGIHSKPAASCRNLSLWTSVRPSDFEIGEDAEMVAGPGAFDWRDRRSRCTKKAKRPAALGSGRDFHLYPMDH